MAVFRCTFWVRERFFMVSLSSKQLAFVTEKKYLLRCLDVWTFVFERTLLMKHLDWQRQQLRQRRTRRRQRELWTPMRAAALLARTVASSRRRRLLLSRPSTIPLDANPVEYSTSTSLSATLIISGATFASALHSESSSPSLSARRSALLEGKSRKPRPPPLFTSNIPTFRVDANSGKRKFSNSTAPVGSKTTKDVLSAAAEATDNNNAKSIDKNKDCPICRKYSKGPCGSMFTKWMDCADANPGKDADTGEELHLSQCGELAEKLANCLARHGEYYAGPIDYDDDDSDTANNTADEKEVVSAKDLAEAWSDLIVDIESSKRATKSFPDDIRPEMEVRPASGWGVASFAPTDHRDEPLIMAYLKDQNGNILAAGSGEDMNDTGGFLRFSLEDDTEAVTAYALYGGDEDDPLYERRGRLPPR